MNTIRNLKIRDKLLLLLSLLLIPLIYFVISTIKYEVQENNKLKQEAVQLEESEKLSDLIHEFQKERARMLAATVGDASFQLDAKAQRRLTDAAERDLKDFILTSGRNFPELSMLSELRRYRNDLDKGRLDVEDFREYSTGLLFHFLERLDANATGISSAEIARQLASFRSLAEAKIQLGRIRTQVIKAIPEGVFSIKDYARIISQLEFYNVALKNFFRNADEKSAQEVHQITSSGSYKKLAELFQAIENNPEMELTDLDPATTFNEFAQGIESFRLAETRLINRIRKSVSEASVRKKQYMIMLSGVFILLLVLVSTLSFYIINRISSSLSLLKKAADRIRLGATDVVINVDSQDEIGSVATSFRGVLRKNIALSQVAQAIGEGRYDVEVEVLHDEDRLSSAIRDMKNSLKAFTTENRDRSWILTGVAELNSLIARETVLDNVTEKAIGFLCNYTGSDAGIIYLYDDNKGNLEPAATYGVQYDRKQLPAFGMGTGTVGQAVSDRQVKVLEGVPAEYMKIKTGLTEIEKASVIIIPLLFSEIIVGALELCSRRPYSSLHLQFFKTVSERVAVVVQTLKAHLQTQDLLYETQNQAEELETQQEELRQLNAELKTSEEELRVNQEELQEKNAELEEKSQLLEEQFEALQNKNVALEDAREAIELKIQQVEEVSKYKSDFLANMSHELRTPLNSILILSRLLTENPEQNLTAKQVDHAQIIHKSGNDLLRLINEILDLSKIESGMIRLENKEIKLDEIKLEPLFGEVAAKKNIRYSERYIPGASDTIITDRFRLEQILKNFIGNAIKFTNEGGEVELSVYPVIKKPNFKSEQLRQQTDIIAFSVRDTGIGIARDKQQEVFEAFLQADSSTTRKYGGTGLGLTISKELAALLGGEIILESEPGKGSIFTLYLPRVPATEGQQVPVATTAAPPQSRAESVSQVFEGMESKDKKETIVLIIEDDKGFSDILADFAVAKNFKVHQAYTGGDGLRLARQEKPDAILLDIQLPDISGWEVLRQIREDKELRHVNVHVMSAYDEEIKNDQTLNEDYLPKPVTLEMLNKAFSSISATSGTSINNILIVEDNEIENKAVTELLLAHGLKSTAAFSAEEAEQVLERQKVDCIILDLNLPGMKGYEWMKKIRSRKGLSSIPIIIYSGKDLSEEEESALKEFANTIIIKNEYSYLRLLDEVQLFLHKVNQKLPPGNEFKMKLHVPEEILQSKKVLLADDDVRNIYSLSSLLEQHGMEVIVAYNGKEALQKLEAEKGIAVVLMDIMMPEMDGIEAIKRIREDSRFKQLPIIALTAKAMKEDKEKCIEAGASDYLPKPVDTDKLLTLMRVWLYEA